MTVWNSLRSSFVAALHHPWLWLLQFLGNIAIALVFVAWLRIDVANGWQVFLNFFLGVLVIMAALLLHGGTLDYHSEVAAERTATLVPALKNALRHMPAFAVSVAIFYLVLHFVDKLDNYEYTFPGYLRSEFPAWLRRHVTEQAMVNLYDGFVSLLRWVVVPGLLLPLWLQCASLGFRGFLQIRSWLHSLGNVAYWIVMIVGALVGVYCTSKLMNWRLHPAGAAVTKEGIWLAFRLLIAYLLALFGWLWICAALARAPFRPDPPAAEQKAAA
jgi:hypothetical protein